MFLPDVSANATPGVAPPANFVGASMAGPGGTVGLMGMLGQTGTPGPTQSHPVGTGQSGTEWTMEVQNVNVKGDKAAGHRRKVAGSDQHREGPPVKKRRKAPERESKADKEKERDRDRENMPTAPVAKAASRVSVPSCLTKEPMMTTR
jgi:paired amphipathic helix protein Sin3a